MAIRVNSNADGAGVTAIGYNSGNNSTISNTNCSFFGNDANVNAGITGIDRKTEDGEYLDMIVQFRKVGKKMGNKNMT